MKFRLGCSEGRLALTLADEPIENFLASSLWKVRLSFAKSKRPELHGQTLLFPADLSIADWHRIAASLEGASRFGVTVEHDSSFEKDVASNGGDLEERARVGLSIKAHDPVLLERFEGFSETVNSLMIRPLRERQMWDAFFMSAMGSSANFSVPGSGKTSAVLGAFAFLRQRGEVERIVVISPKNAFGSWRDEWAACFGRAEPCRSLCFHDRKWTGVDRAGRQRELRLGYRGYNLILLNYESANYGESLYKVVRDKSLLVFDEVHKVKRVHGKRAEDALAVARCAKYVVALTGTPIPNSYLDVYNLLHILYPDDYDWYFGFREQTLKKADKALVEKVNASIQPFFCRTSKKMLGVPEPEPDDLVAVPASGEETEALRELKGSLARDPLAMIVRVLQLESDQRMLEEDISWDDIEGLVDAADEQSLAQHLSAPMTLVSSVGAGGSPVLSTKTRACIDLVSRLCGEGKKVIVWCIFKRSMANISSLLNARGHSTRVVSGATGMDERQEILDDFKLGGLEVLVTNPHTLAESVSLHMVCHDAVYFECSYNLVHLLQSKDRINRLGLPDGQYTQYHFLQSTFSVPSGAWSLDQNIYSRLCEKEQTMLDAIDRGVLEPGSTDERDLDLILDGLFGDDDGRVLS
uniref:SNF2-related protein n=1 Tax=Parolsenella massiliensis TaxID=1871022 RepID=UPI0009FB5A32|nr:SNF2-related protein [Parolsenella massiliensis]